MKNEQPEVVLYWDGHAVDCFSRGIGTLHLSFVTVRTNEQGVEKVRNPCYDSDAYADLELHTQWNLDTGCVYHPGCTYGDEAYYKSPYAVRRRDAERMLKMLKKIERVKFPVRPATFGQWAVLLCKGLGIKRLCIVENPSRGWHTENQHTFCPIGEVQAKIDNAICETFPTPVAKN